MQMNPYCIRRSVDNGELFVTRGKREKGGRADTTRRLSLSEASLLRRFFAIIFVHKCIAVRREYAVDVV